MSNQSGPLTRSTPSINSDSDRELTVPPLPPCLMGKINPYLNINPCQRRVLTPSQMKTVTQRLFMPPKSKAEMQYAQNLQEVLGAKRRLHADIYGRPHSRGSSAPRLTKEEVCTRYYKQPLEADASRKQNLERKFLAPLLDTSSHLTSVDLSNFLERNFSRPVSRQRELLASRGSQRSVGHGFPEQLADIGTHPRHQRPPRQDHNQHFYADQISAANKLHEELLQRYMSNPSPSRSLSPAEVKSSANRLHSPSR